MQERIVFALEDKLPDRCVERAYEKINPSKLSDRCVERAYGKINLSLDVLGKRSDGYHEVSMVMQSVSLYDWILIKALKEEGFSMTANMNYVPTDQSNLMMKAASLMFSTYHLPGGLQMRLEKKIPVAAGMAGGSSDAAAVIRGINELYHLNLSTDELCRVGVQIGADVPFCILGGTCLSEGIGEKLTRLKKAPRFYALLVKPGFSVSTREVYQAFDELKNILHPNVSAMVSAIQKENRAELLNNMGNVLEEVTAKAHPIIGEIKQSLLNCGASGALMSGSGPTVFGLFSGKTRAYIALKIIRKQYKRTFTQLVEFV